jgi:homoserine dehydrogenase
MTPTRPLRVGVLGAGTVGREVVRAFNAFPERLVIHGGARLELVGVAVRDMARARATGIAADLLTDAPAHLVASDDTDIVVELMGGDEPARTLIAAALASGKAVVTANKHVIAHHGPELEAIARRTGAALRFEAAVGGGIPVLGPLGAELAGDRVTRVRGIVNGTTNYILSAMADEGRAYDEVLAAAQAAGYAEADPSGDVEGDDAVNKLVILIRLAFGAWVDPADVVRHPTTAGPGGRGRPGITGVSAADIAGATALGATIKLVADARRPDDRIGASVLPTVVPLVDPMGRTNGVTNRIEVRAEPVGDVAFVGPGAGGGATSSAVLGDLLAIARGIGSTWAGLPPAGAIVPGGLDGPPEQARDRGWFAIVPGEIGSVERAGGEVRTAPVPQGTAVILREVPLSAARSLFLAAGLPDAATILPADISRRG